MTELRKQFEALPEIASILRDEDTHWCDKRGIYVNQRVFQDSTTGYLNGAWYAFQEQQKKIDLFNKMILSLRNEFNLWADDTESFNAIEAQIEDLEEFLK